MADGAMLVWGDATGSRFTFSLSSAAYQKLARTDTWRWVTQERFANAPAEQFVGPGSTTILLEGVIFSSYNPGAGVPNAVSTPVGTHQLDILRRYADEGVSKILMDGRGWVLGPFVLVGMKEEQEYILVNGAPQKQAFNLEFRSYGDDAKSAAPRYNPQPPASASAAVVGAIAQALIAAGVPAANAQADDAVTNALVANTPSMAPYAVRMAMLVGSTWGLTGPAFKAAMTTFAAQLASRQFVDASSVLDGGLPSLDDTLAKLGSQNGDQALNALTLLTLVPASELNRGDFLANMASSLDALAKDAYMTANGVNIAPADPADAVAAKLEVLSALAAKDPNFADRYAVGANAALMTMANTAALKSLNAGGVFGDSQFAVTQEELSAAGIGADPAPPIPNALDTVEGDPNMTRNDAAAVGLAIGVNAL